MFQLYVHRDPGVNRDLVARCKAAGFDSLALTVDTIVGGNRERDLRTGFTTPPKLTPGSALSFATHPAWTWNYLRREAFSLANLAEYFPQGSNLSMAVAEYINTMLDPAMDWKQAEAICADWGGPFALKGVMSVADARRAIDIGASAIIISNHGGRQLDGCRAPFDQLAEIVDAIGDRIEVICEGGIRRGNHVLKALSLGATACAGGRLYLYALAAAGEEGVDRVVGRLRAEIERGMKLMGVTAVDQLGRDNLRWR
jgi:L-lactate dehydrogenase (cytochrome)